MGLVLLFSVQTSIVQNYITPKVAAAPGDGYMLLFWDGVAAPTDWTCVSCTGGDPFYQVFPRGNDTYGGTGGTATHTHTASGSVDATTTPMPSRSLAGTGLNGNAHTHTFSPTIGSASNLPVYRQLNIIRHNNSGNPSSIPAGAIAIFDSTVPSGWTQYSSQNGYYPYGENTAGTTGGSNTHTHAITGTTSGSVGDARSRNTAGAQDNVSSNGHTHDASGTSLNASNEPPYIEVIFGQLDSDASPTFGMYAMWDDDPTTEWLIKSAGGGPLNQRFFKGSSSYGTTGGNITHNHNDVSYLSGTPSAPTTTSRTGGTPSASDDLHTHTVNVTGFSADSNVPPYKDVIIAKLQQPSELAQSSYRWFANQDSTDVGAPLASQNVVANAPKQGNAFRLRLAIHVTVSDRDINGAGLKLQYALRSGSCDVSFSGETYSDVSPSAGAIRFYDNTTPTSADALTSNANDPTHSSDTIVDQSYVEANNFTNNQSTIAIGEDGLWDFSLVDFSSSASTSYCFRVVRATDDLLESYSVIPEITTDDGLGHMLIFWDGGSAPTGWTCVSCNVGDDFYQKFIRGEAIYGGTGGSATHTHNASGTTDSDTEGLRSGAGSGTIRSHSHTSTPTIGPASNLPVYRQLQVLRNNTSGTPGTIPAGAIAIFDSTVPAGWVRYSAQDGNYIRGENTVGATGGSNTHTHSINGVTDPGSGVLRAPNIAGTQGPAATDSHTHTYSGNSDSQSNEPPYVNTILGKLSSDSSATTNMLVMWDGTIPGSWTSQSESGGPFYQNFMKPAATFGGTSGASSHAHGSTNIVTSAPSATVNSRTGGTLTASSGSHTHIITINGFSTDSNLPPYIDVIIAKLTGSNTLPNIPNSLDQIEVSSSTSISVGGWSDETQVRFEASLSDTDNPDDLSVCVEVQQIGTPFTNTETSCGSAVTYSGSPVTATLTITGLTNTAEYHWQARAKDSFGTYSTWVSFGGNAESARDFAVDDTDPSGTAYDGSTVSIDIEYNDGSLDVLEANWDITDANSGVALYEYSIGTAPGSIDIVNWTNNGISTAVSVGSLSLKTSSIYYFNVRTTDIAGNSSIVNSDGQQVAPTLTFTTSSGTVSFNGLNAGNSYTDTQSTILTTNTNANNGYIVRLSATGLLQTVLGDSIGMFNGATYAAPNTWLGGDTGYGYTSSDNSIQGVNKFNPVTCAGGGSGPCYAPISQSLPGDIVADNTSTITGTPIINEQFTITHRVTVDPNQPAGNYETTLIFSASAIY